MSILLYSFFVVVPELRGLNVINPNCMLNGVTTYRYVVNMH